jgi:hypothetical protein
MTEDTILIAAASMYYQMRQHSDQDAAMRLAVNRAIELIPIVRKKLAELELGTQETMWKEK